jgi:hypothetical protein
MVQYFPFQLLIRYLSIRSSKHQLKGYYRISTGFPSYTRPSVLAIIRSRSNAEAEYYAMASTTREVNYF